MCYPRILRWLTASLASTAAGNPLAEDRSTDAGMRPGAVISRPREKPGASPQSRSSLGFRPESKASEYRVCNDTERESGTDGNIDVISSILRWQILLAVSSILEIRTHLTIDNMSEFNEQLFPFRSPA